MGQVVWVETVSSQLLGLGGGSKSINHASMHRVRHDEVNESSAHGVPRQSRRVLSHMRPAG